MKVLLIDNEPSVCETLMQMLQTYCPGIDEIRTANGVVTGLQAIRSYQPDILFLDVEMDDGTGFDLIKQLDAYHFQLIFVTAHNQYAINAFKFSAIDFIQKPVDADDLLTAYNKAVESIRTKDIARQIEVLQSSLSQLKPAQQKIVLRDHKSLYFVQVADIYHCEADGSYTCFFLKDGQRIMVSKPLKEYEVLLEPFGFLRTHHSHLVNTAKISRLDKADGGKLILDNGTEVPVSQRKMDQIVHWLEK